MKKGLSAAHSMLSFGLCPVLSLARRMANRPAWRIVMKSVAQLLKFKSGQLFSHRAGLVRLRLRSDAGGQRVAPCW